MKHELPDLPFPMNALEPYMSTETLEYHYGRHHKGYVDTLNKLIQTTPYEHLSLEETIRTATGPIYNNAAQVWNHTFFWNSISPEKLSPTKNTAEKLENNFTSLDSFFQLLRNKAVEHFGSGYLWLVLDESKLRVETTSEADNWLKTALRPIFTCDLWEHAYYIDHRNERGNYIDNFLYIINWQFIDQNLQMGAQ